MATSGLTLKPKAYISYSWSSQQHQELVRRWADRLIGDGVDVVIDQYDLAPGNDAYSFMERMVTDSTVTHVLVVCDPTYTDKANARRAGVGVESQIISSEIYERVDQSKFIPIVTAFDSDGNAILPAFMSSLVWIDFSSDEKVNESWEGLVRLLFNRPRLSKPKLGAMPPYLEQDSVEDGSEIELRFEELRSAAKTGNPNFDLLRSEFVKTCIRLADEMRVREPLELSDQDLGMKVMNDCRQLVVVRDALVDWLFLDLAAGNENALPSKLMGVLESLLELKARPEELRGWRDTWFGAHSIFVYETFLYIVSTLIRFNSVDVLRTIFEHNYMLPLTERGTENFGRYDRFWGSSDALTVVLRSPDERRYLSPAAELVKRQATRADLGFLDVMEAELLVFFFTLTDDNRWWYPGTLHYASYSWVSPLFLKATRREDFKFLSRIVGIENADELRARVKERFQALASSGDSMDYFWMQGSPLSMMNIDAIDTL
ncbi:MAG: toll/interleukin-1 receptor domain-containing protein [Gammaproteobacteria bacterium]|nr:toll/interleukin-1 receptor domain-containing protein [Gammaproteobacteria bacterium]